MLHQLNSFSWTFMLHQTTPMFYVIVTFVKVHPSTKRWNSRYAKHLTFGTHTVCSSSQQTDPALSSTTWSRKWANCMQNSSPWQTQYFENHVTPLVCIRCAGKYKTLSPCRADTSCSLSAVWTNLIDTWQHCDCWMCFYNQNLRNIPVEQYI